MPRTLVTWSDRGSSGPRPLHHGARPSTDRGPVMRLVTQPDWQRRYDRAIVLTTEPGQRPAQGLVEELGHAIAEVELVVLRIHDPSDYAEVFAALAPLVNRLAQKPAVDILLSAGTPQMQTLWVILVEAGLITARMLQVIPSAFVPSVHAHPVREVELDIAGFPEIRALRDEVVRLRGQARSLNRHFVGHSEPMRKLANRLSRVAPTDLPVLIQGETGTGKELVARAVHESSHRASGPLISENCAAFTDSMLTSELFGHEKGAFTGAAHSKRGLFEMAHGGTLFLDEVGELSPRVQAHLLRVLQDGTLRRLGSETSVRVDVRVIAATHRDLRAMVDADRFREDLYYRLQGATLHLPALRDRIEDLEPLAAHFLAEVGSSLKVTREAWRQLKAHPWPGNIRELRAEVMRWHVFCDRWVRAEDLSIHDDAGPRVVSHEPQPPLHRLAKVVADAERGAIQAALSASHGNISQAAKALDIDRNTLKRKLRKLNIPHTPLPRGRQAERW